MDLQNSSFGGWAILNHFAVDQIFDLLKAFTGELQVCLYFKHYFVHLLASSEYRRNIRRFLKIDILSENIDFHRGFGPFWPFSLFFDLLPAFSGGLRVCP